MTATDSDIRTAPAAQATLRRAIVSVSDLDAALRLYRDVLGLPVRTRYGPFAELDTAAGVPLLLHQRPTVPSDAAVALGFAVADLDGVVARWRNNGGQIVDPPAPQPWGERMATVRDADGHLVCLGAA